ncbi:MAG TPA: hypothetical protein VHA11_04645 [Bryobacteraceae bacterium]|nr:hypothetical protein [Bryobacteraceae bacterium]
MRQLIIWAGLLTVSTVPNVAQHVPESQYSQDPRLGRLRQFLERAHSPIRHLAVDFLRAADRHRLDWRLLPSISVIETGAGRTAVQNNIFGWDSGRKAFTSVREAIYLVASRLGTSKLYRDKDLDEVLTTYNPLPEYPGKVKSVMRQVDASEPLQARTPSNPSFALRRTSHLIPAP